MARSSMRRLCCLVNVSAESGERNSITADLAPESTWGGLEGRALSLLVGLSPEALCSPGWP